MPRVFLPQMPKRFDIESGEIIDAINIEDAKRYGEVIIIIPDEHFRFTPEQAARHVRSELCDFGEDDYLVAVGDPTAIALCAGYIMRFLPTLKLLKWDRRNRLYNVVNIHI